MIKFKSWDFAFFKRTKDKEKTIPLQSDQSQGKPYVKLYLVNKVLTVVLRSTGDVISKQEATEALYNQLRDASSEEELISILFPPEQTTNVKVSQEEKAMDSQRKASLEITARTNFPLLEQADEFQVLGNVVQFKGIDRSIPNLLIKHFIAILTRCRDKGTSYKEDKEYLSLKRFFLWACLNRRPEVADKLYDFLHHNVMRLTSQGFFVALRNVVTIQGRTDEELVDFVSNTYNKIKAVWKRKPEDYAIIRTGPVYHFVTVVDYLMEGHLDESIEYVGTVKDLYDDLPNLSGNRYTDNHTRTFDIRIGQAMNMNPDDCDWSTVDCGSGGLHGTLDEINYVGCGDTSVLMLVNPMKVVGIGTTKFRCWEYFPVMTVKRTEATRILYDFDFDTLELDEVYAAGEMKGLEAKVIKLAQKEEKKYSFSHSDVFFKSAAVAIKELSQIKKELSKRVVTI